MALTCPHCKRLVTEHGDQRWRPFCSERCKLIDLGAWASEKHVISSTQDEPSEFDVDSPLGESPSNDS